MKKFSLLIGALGGGLAGYLLSNKKLREQLTQAKDAEAAAKLLGKHLQKDGKKLAKHAQEFMESDEVQGNLLKAKQYAKEKVDEAADELGKMFETGKQAATKKAKSVAKKAKSAAKKTVKRATGKAKKTATKAKKKPSRRMKTNVRKVS